MTILPKTLLIVAIIGLTAGSIVAVYGDPATPAVAALLPLGAIAFGMFLIVLILEKEMAAYDREEANKPQPVAPSAAATGNIQKNGPAVVPFRKLTA